MYEVLLILTVALIWGFTNPLMKHGIDYKVNNRRESGPSPSSKIRAFLEDLKLIILNWRYLLAYGINQSGSLLYYYSLGQTDLSFASPLANALTFVFTFIFGRFIFGEKSELNGTGWIGLGLVILGVSICLIDKIL